MANYNTDNLLKHLNDRWQGAKCPLCQSGKWNVSDNVFELRQFNQGNLIMGNVPIVPIIPVTCSNCGNTVLINALIAKAIEPPTIPTIPTITKTIEHRTIPTIKATEPPATKEI